MISKQLLCHECTVETISLNEDREEEVVETFHLSTVRIHREMTRIADANGFSVVTSATLWFDREQSQPRGFVPKLNQRVTGTDGSVWTVKGVKANYRTSDNIEFFEAALV